ncbi:cob(I)yrinic acid a,c-diamide adenosyltransferase [Cytophagaceae bacterium ABcell3]|nr:cob(I)yrinic acid a,c-diamide adenosyltransferase [Cytophagaceae bacterium ABcell3]
MKIYTKTGDKGKTSLLGGTRVSKSDARLHAYGTVDELNSWIGLIADLAAQEETAIFLRNIQNTLFVIGSKLAAGPNNKYPLPELKKEETTALENEIDRMNEILPELKSFILPGGHSTVSHCHIARSVCRRAERYVAELADTSPGAEPILVYLNRLSDYLFVLARKTAFDLNTPEIPWKVVN